MAPEGGTPLVTGRVVIGAASPGLRGATVHIRLEDTSYQDAPATLVAEVAISGVDHPAAGAATSSDAGGTTVPFEIASAGNRAIDAQADYRLRVWVDADGDGQPGPGDLYSDASQPVLTRGFGNDVTIALSPP